MDPNDGEFGGVNPGPCATDNGIGGYNRILDITGMLNDTILPVYEFNTCNTLATSIIDTELEGVVAFPNPMRDLATVRLNGYDGLPYSIRLTNLVGQTVMEMDNLNQGEVTIDGSTLEAGVYFIQVTKDARQRTLKMIIE